MKTNQLKLVQDLVAADVSRLHLPENPSGLTSAATVWNGTLTQPIGTSTFNVRGSTFNVSLILLLLAATGSASAATRYVWQNSPSPAPPFESWASAAHVIQDAVDAALAGDEIVVTNGVYATGGRTVGTNLLVNRVAVDKPLTLRSVNGPQSTVIQGYQVPGTTNGDGAIRCVYLTNGASLSGFTLTNGATRSAGGNSRETHGGGVWCESTSAVVSNCVLVVNSASEGGGGAYGGMLNNCALTGNSAQYYGGGAGTCTLNNCTLTGNSAQHGGGADTCTLNNCTLTGNSANGPYGRGGGAEYSTLNNCIVYFNTSPNGANYYQDQWGGSLNYCCTTPLPTNGVGNITIDPQLASASHLSAGSPCRAAGSPACTIGTDIDGEVWGVPPSIGCDEYHAGAVTGPLSVGIAAAFTNVATGFPVDLRALIEGRTAASVWDFGDGIVVSNQPYASHAWTMPGNYQVVLRAYNESAPAGVTATVAIQVVSQPVHYVAAGSANPLPPYATWATAAMNIQDAVDAAVVGGTVLVTNGTYATGGRAVGTSALVNRVAVDKPLTLRSVKGPQFTIIQGYQVPGTTNGDGAIRCVYLTNGASLAGFTLTNGATRVWSSGIPWGETEGGGVWCESEAALVSNCILAGNSASHGGGAARGTLNSCTLTDNSADSAGGGAYFATLNDCTLTGNSSSPWGWGGGVFGGTLNNCTLAGNAAWVGGGACAATLNNCTLTGNSAGWCGGGASPGLEGPPCTLNNCILTGNSAGSYGGGAYWATLNNCTVTGNGALDRGGGAERGTLNNCIIYFNTATNGANYYQDQWGGLLNFCCTTPLPTNGVGNITNAPLFVDYAGGSLRLQSNSPCINAGNNSSLTYYYDDTAELWVTNLFDLDGNPRIVSGTVDIGAYEFQGPGSMISYAWLQHYGLPTDGSADAADPDRDGHTTWQEWRCLTDPTNALSALRLLTASPAGTNVTVSWQSVLGVNYFLERSTNLSASPPFTLLAPNLPGQPGTTTFTDTNAVIPASLFYRVGVSE